MIFELLNKSYVVITSQPHLWLTSPSFITYKRPVAGIRYLSKCANRPSQRQGPVDGYLSLRSMLHSWFFQKTYHDTVQKEAVLGCPRKLVIVGFISHIQLGEITQWSVHHWSQNFQRTGHPTSLMQPNFQLEIAGNPKLLGCSLENLQQKTREKWWLEDDVPFEMVPFQVKLFHFRRFNSTFQGVGWKSPNFEYFNKFYLNHDQFQQYCRSRRLGRGKHRWPFMQGVVATRCPTIPFSWRQFDSWRGGDAMGSWELSNFDWMRYLYLDDHPN